MIDQRLYELDNKDTLQTPALVFYQDIIEENTRKAIAIAGGPHRLWPHVKSHKMRDMIRMQVAFGITRYKCATIAEAQMAAEGGAEHVLLAYPQVGPTIERFLRLQKAYPACTFYAIGDDANQMASLAEASRAQGLRTRALVDVNIGMNRTGIDAQGAQTLFADCAGLDGLEMAGLHCYDGHVHDADFAQRKEHADEGIKKAHGLREALRAQGLGCDLLILGGTPTLPVHAEYEDVYLSPGTVFLGDVKCMRDSSDIDIVPAAGIWGRVVSHPGDRLFTLDIGVKAISTDQADGRGVIAGCPQAISFIHSEEHWVWSLPEGEALPAIGTMFFVIPLHICPAVALYPYAHVARQGRLADRWEVTARNRSIGI